MAKPPANSSAYKNNALVYLEYILLGICLCVIALRATYTESLIMQSTAPAGLNPNVYTLSISAVLFFSFVLWFIWGFCSKRFLYRFTAIEIGLCLFCIAATIAGFAASNRRTAITDAVCLTAPVLMAILLVQILDSQSKIKLVLVVIAALGVVSAYQCAEQFFVSNQAMIDQYEQDPQTILGPLGVQPGSLRQFLIEHRIYSKDVRGFFTTGNSAGSFMILAYFTVIALFIDKFKNRKSPSFSFLPVITCGIAAAVIIFGLIITHSKGAIAASLIATAMFIVCLRFGNWLKIHKKAILLVCLLFFIAVGWAVVAYGLTHDRLPGGNSMLVRWQYWRAAAQMYTDHSFTGVGPGNFVHSYAHYKPAAAMESVANPHNFLLSILTQYGPLGLLGFLAMVFIPLWRTTPPSSIEHQMSSIEKSSSQADQQPSSIGITYLTIISIALLLIRPIIMPVTAGDNLNVVIYAIFTLYVAPVITFVVGFWLLSVNKKNQTHYTIRDTQHTIRNMNITTAALFCAALGVLLHNLIDFAIFEPPVLTAFWAIVACLIALDYQQKPRPQPVLSPPIFAKVIAVAVALVIFGIYICFAWLPVYKSTAKIQQAKEAASVGKFEKAHNFLTAAAKDDPLSSIPSLLNGRLYLQRFLESEPKQSDLLQESEKQLREAIKRNKADPENFERLTEVYNQWAEVSTQKRADLLTKAFDSANRAVELYPGVSRLRIELAKTAEKLGKTEFALQQYKKAVEIEDAYRRQFRIMYPHREVFSRLGEEKYNSAKQRIKSLTDQLTP